MEHRVIGESRRGEQTNEKSEKGRLSRAFASMRERVGKAVGGEGDGVYMERERDLFSHEQRGLDRDAEEALAQYDRLMGDANKVISEGGDK